MNKLKILHTADWKYGAPFDCPDESKTLVRHAELLTLPARIVSLAEQEQVDLVLICGEIVSQECSKEKRDDLLRTLGRIPAPVFLAPSKENLAAFRGVETTLPSNVHVFDKTACISVESIHASIFGVISEEKLTELSASDISQQKAESEFYLLCMGSCIDDILANRLFVEKISDYGIDYLALGGSTYLNGLHMAENIPYSQPGSPEGHGYSEPGEHAVSIVEWEQGVCKVRPVSVAIRNYSELVVKLPVKNLVRNIQKVIPDDSVRNIFRIVLRGETTHKLDIQSIGSELKPLFYDLQICDETELSSQVWDWEDPWSLRGVFLKTMHDRIKKAENDADRRRLEQAVLWGLAAFDQGELRHEDQ